MKSKNKAKVMTAPDMFIKGNNQKFDAKTGERLSYGHNEPEPEFKPLPAPQIDLFLDTQINLF